MLINNDTYAHIMDKKILWINLKFLSFRPSSRHNNIVNCNNTLFFCSSFFHFISFKLGCFRIDLDGLYQLGLYRVLAVLRKKNDTIDAWFGKKIIDFYLIIEAFGIKIVTTRIPSIWLATQDWCCKDTPSILSLKTYISK